MQRGFKLHNYQITKLQSRSRGYILITLMLFFTLLAISALAVLPRVAQQIKRDREEEMIHRGVQYTRAVRRYYRKLGRYPTRIEELESSNNLRFLRKRYKDPMTGKEFRILRLGDPALAMMGFGQGFGQQGLQGLQPGMLPGQENRPGFVASPNGRPAGPGNANMPQATGLPGSVNTVQQTNPDNTENPDASGESNSGDSSSSSSASSSGSSSGRGGQVFGGGPIVGVISTSNDSGIREFNDKKRYKEWPFIYDPSSDRGGLLNTPTIPGLNQGVGNVPGQAGGQPGNQQNPAPQPGPPNSQQPPEE